MNSQVQNPLGIAPVGGLIAKFAIPAIISMLVSAMYNIVDQIFIGQGVGMLGNAATNVAFPVTTIATALALLLGIGGASNYNLEISFPHSFRSCWSWMCFTLIICRLTEAKKKRCMNIRYRRFSLF